MLPDRLPNQGIVQTDQKSVDDRALNNSPILEQLLDKISSLSSTVDKLNERVTSLESAPVKDSDNMVAEQENASCPEPTDVSDQLSVVVRPDPEIESYGPVILDPNSGHRVGNITSKSLTQGHKNDPACLSENNNGDCGKNLSDAEGQPNQNSAKHLPFDPVAAAPSWEPSTAFKEFLEIKPKSFFITNFWHFGRNFSSRFRCFYNTKT